MNNKQTTENTKHTNIRLDINFYKEIETLAKTNERTVSEQIRYMLKEYIRIKNG